MELRSGQYRAIMYRKENIMVGIYKITNKINGSLYIGCSNNIKRRFTEHRVGRGNGSIARAIRKYGKDNFYYEILEVCSKEDLFEREKYYIKKLKPRYNRNEGGKGNSQKVSQRVKKILKEKGKRQWEKMTEEQKQNIIKNNLIGKQGDRSIDEETRKKISKTLKGRKLKEEHRLHIIEGQKKSTYKRTNENHRKPIRCLETNETFTSVKEATEKYNLTTLVGHLKGRYKTCKGQHYEYL
jgi:group I intron endonuclease